MDSALQGLILENHFFEKPGFGSLELANAMKALCQESKNKGQDFSIELVGLCTDICVVSNALLIKGIFYRKSLSQWIAGVAPGLRRKSMKLLWRLYAPVRWRCYRKIRGHQIKIVSKQYRSKLGARSR